MRVAGYRLVHYCVSDSQLSYVCTEVSRVAQHQCVNMSRKENENKQKAASTRQARACYKELNNKCRHQGKCSLLVDTKVRSQSGRVQGTVPVSHARRFQVHATARAQVVTVDGELRYR